MTSGVRSSFHRIPSIPFGLFGPFMPSIPQESLAR